VTGDVGGELVAAREYEIEINAPLITPMADNCLLNLLVRLNNNG
jgi:hypothetical protein